MIGFDDVEIADYTGLTTVRQPLEESGGVAADLLLARLADGSRPVQHVRLPLTIVKREQPEQLYSPAFPAQRAVFAGSQHKGGGSIA